MPALTDIERKLGTMNLLRSPAERLRFRLRNMPEYLTTTEAKADLKDMLDLVDCARLLLTPGARLTPEDDGSPRFWQEWIKARIRWHRLDGNPHTADTMLAMENSQRRAIGKEPLDA